VAYISKHEQILHCSGLVRTLDWTLDIGHWTYDQEVMGWTRGQVTGYC